MPRRLTVCPIVVVVVAVVGAVGSPLTDEAEVVALGEVEVEIELEIDVGIDVDGFGTL